MLHAATSRQVGLCGPSQSSRATLQQRRAARSFSSLSAGPSTPAASHRSIQSTFRLHAKRRELDVAYFSDLFESTVEKFTENPTARLPHMDLLVMINSIESMQEAAKALGILGRQVAARVAAGEEDTDWHMRKKYLVALMEVAWTRFQAPQLAFEVMANPQRYQTATYFCCDVLEALSKAKAPAPVLIQIFEINKLNRPPGDKGVRASLRDLAAALKQQNAITELRMLVGAQFAGRPDRIRFQPEIEQYVNSLSQTGGSSSSDTTPGSFNVSNSGSVSTAPQAAKVATMA